MSVVQSDESRLSQAAYDSLCLLKFNAFLKRESRGALRKTMNGIVNSP